VRIILADDQEKVRSALRLVINQEPDIDVIEEVDNSKALLEAIKKSQPDLLISDWDLIKNEPVNIETFPKSGCKYESHHPERLCPQSTESLSPWGLRLYKQSSTR
jgi:DNA-binding NarL/FixJ family response regulator